MRLTPLEWGLRGPVTPRLGGNCWALPRLGEIGAKRRIINRPKTQNFGCRRSRKSHASTMTYSGQEEERAPSIYRAGSWSPEALTRVRRSKVS